MNIGAQVGIKMIHVTVLAAYVHIVAQGLSIRFVMPTTES